MEFYTRFNPPPTVTIGFPVDKDTSQSKVHDEFKTECDINEIIRRFRVTGVLTDPSKPSVRRPMFGDFSEVPDADARERVYIAAQQAWDSLTDAQRDKFPGGPAEILEALHDDNRKADLVAAGILLNHSQGAEAPTPEPPKAAQGATQEPPVA